MPEPGPEPGPGSGQETGDVALPAWVDRELYPFEGRWLDLEGEGSVHYLD